MNSNGPNSLSVQIVASWLFVIGIGLIGLMLVGHNAIGIVDDSAAARQERFAARNLAAEVSRLPDDQRSVTIWDDTIIQVARRDQGWMDENIGIWLQEYFGHDEIYVLDHENQPIYAAISTGRAAASLYAERAEAVAPLVAQLRADMAEESEGRDNPFAELAELSAVATLQFDDFAAIVSVVPIVSHGGEIPQAPGMESLHVALQYVDADLARRIGGPIELQDMAFGSAPPENGRAGVPVTRPTGDAIAWLTWEPEQPGTALVMRMLPVLASALLAGSFLLWWIVRRLLRVSGQLQVSEAQARFLAHHDALTGLPNRKLFLDRLVQARHMMTRNGQPLALVAIDLDRFKLINDSLGHQAGDELIRQVGKSSSASRCWKRLAALPPPPAFRRLPSTSHPCNSETRNSSRWCSPR